MEASGDGVGPPALLKGLAELMPIDAVADVEPGDLATDPLATASISPVHRGFKRVFSTIRG